MEKSIKKENLKKNNNKNSQKIKKEVLSRINSFFKEYRENLENKDFLLIYKNDDREKEIFIRFLKKNFFHLTGLEIGQRSISPIDFYKKLENKTLKINDIALGKFTEKKLKVYEEMIRIFKEQSRIGDYDSSNFYQKNLSIDKGMALSIPNSDMVLGIRFIGGRYTVPVSLLQQKLENISYKDTITEIVCMFEKNIKEEKYTKIVYTTVEIETLINNNKELEDLLASELLETIHHKNK